MTKKKLTAVECTELIIRKLSNNHDFEKLALIEKERTIKRDEIDNIVLVDGIKYAIKRQTLVKAKSIKSSTLIAVDNLTPDEVVSNIQSKIEDEPKGLLITIQGLSGTGKGTTAELLKSTMANSYNYSNGDVFRSLTYLTFEEAQIERCPFDKEFVEKTLSPDQVKDYIGRLNQITTKTGIDVEIETRLKGKILLSSIKNTDLKNKEISNMVPIVSSKTQGEFIEFANHSITNFRKSGTNIILEGRGTTIDYFDMDYRFELTLNDPIIIGKRRVAQRIVALLESDYLNVDSISTALTEGGLYRILKEEGF